MLRSEAGDDAARIAAVLQGVRAYQDAPRQRPMRRARRIAQRGRASLRDYGGEGTPIVFIPSLINGAEILDLDRQRSLLRWLRAAGLRVLLVDWGTPGSDERHLDLAGHVERLLLPLLARLPEPPILVGYCLGGTLATAAAQAMSVRGLALIAAPWRFAGFPPGSRLRLTELWESARGPAEELGLMPMEIMQSAFWRLDPVRTLAKFEAIGRKAADRRAVASFTTVEDWANAGPPMTFAAARELLEDFFLRDLPGSGAWRVGGQAIDPARFSFPVLEVVSTSDRIVPHASAAGIGDRITLSLGHVGMIVGGRAEALLWQPLLQWLSQARRLC
ncbi:alpha/beta fold hydrolase [Sphingomonas sp. BIUV-7]|uniref:Alpha/beta fold hydrolase n=1 Tax=Sphingomonas natans TaxID=3063330 RepID=A0ABT8Y374_9SPHN|nr:alpha/beta fold hydrolase [Sphingomonas sp. BIUV-7]MDO6412761.1 alpha/beta fold hydrolase [Sphingomonas sp. BIUV-7]